MANILSMDKQTMVIHMLAEGSSIRSVERVTDVHRDTIMRLGVKIGTQCHTIMDRQMRDLPCERLQLDEIWGFVGKKQKHVKNNEWACGDVWTFVAIDADTKAVPCFSVGKRDAATAEPFLLDLSSRLRNRVQISTDGLRAYVDAVEKGFGCDVDYGQIVKTYAAPEKIGQSRYSPADVVKIDKAVVSGNPVMADVSTSYIERQNLTMRMHCRRLTRLTNAFSKKWENFQAAVALHFCYYNFVKVHATLRTTPAMAVGATKTLWTVSELIERCHDQ